ncbi:MAG: hypothetical protein ACHQUB_03215 [Candidatus Saccharimonadia bacterium]
MKYRFQFFVPILVAIVSCLVLGGRVQAADYSQNLLMDDAVFNNVGSLNATQIQTFLNGSDGRMSSASTCLATYQTPNFYWDGTAWHYGDSSSGTSAWNTSYGPANISAAQAIYQAAQLWGINPEVIIATIEKEESLVSGTSCDGWRYSSSMGYGCPDSGGCNPTYAGFTKQVLWGAYQLEFGQQRSYGNIHWDGDETIKYYGYMTTGNRARCGAVGGACSSADTQLIYYDGNATIDNQTVYMTNGATASLYTYTPHLGNSTPRIFEQWFGPAILPTYSWSIVSQTYGAGSLEMVAGTKQTVTLVAQNTGSATWVNNGANPAKLGTTGPNDRTSNFYDSSWPAPNRPAVMTEPSVASGQNGTFTFTVDAPTTPGTYYERFNLLSEGVTWFNDPGMYFTFKVDPITYAWSIVSQTYNNGSINMSPGQSAILTVIAKNTGNVAWTNSGSFPVKLAPVAPEYRQSAFYDSSWPSPTRTALLTESSVAPGQNGTFSFKVNVPPIGGLVQERFSLVAEGYAWFNDPGMYFTINITNGYQWQIVSQIYSDGTPNIGAGQSENLTVVAKNTGTATWHNTGAFLVKLATDNPHDRTSLFATPAWPAPTRASTMTEASVVPGQNGTFTFPITAPTKTGIYLEYLNLVDEGYTWFNDPGMYFYLNVQ